MILCLIYVQVCKAAHTLLAQEYFRNKGSRAGFEVYVYKDDIFIGHFSSYLLYLIINKVGSSKTITN